VGIGHASSFALLRSPRDVDGIRWISGGSRAHVAPSHAPLPATRAAVMMRDEPPGVNDTFSTARRNPGFKRSERSGARDADPVGCSRRSWETASVGSQARFVPAKL